MSQDYNSNGNGDDGQDTETHAGNGDDNKCRSHSRVSAKRGSDALKYEGRCVVAHANTHTKTGTEEIRIVHKILTKITTHPTEGKYRYGVCANSI